MKIFKVISIFILFGTTLSFASKYHDLSDGIKMNKRGDFLCDFSGVGTQDGILEPLRGSGIGDVKYSILSEAKFREVNGPEWVLMRGQAKTDLSIEAGNNSVFQYLNSSNYSTANLPDPRGRFFRMIGTPDVEPARKIGHQQGDAFQAHSHGGIYRWSSREGANGIGGLRILSEYTYNTSSIGSVSGYGAVRYNSETRPVNIAINAFVKIKRKCVQSLKVISDIEVWKEKTSCDPQKCLDLTNSSITDEHERIACIKTSIDQYESQQKMWSIGCVTANVVNAKRFLMILGDDRTAEEEEFLEHLDNQYPYYNATMPGTYKKK